MLTVFRKGGVAQLVVGAVAVTIIIVFALEFRPGRNVAGQLTQQCAVQVYDACIDQKEFMAAYGLIVPYGASPKMVKQLGLRRHILDGLVERELLVAEAERLGVGISKTAIDDELATGRFRVSLPASERMLSRQLFLCRVSQTTGQCEPGSEMLRYVPEVKNATGAFDYSKYERIIRNVANRGPKEFKEMQERELIADRMRALVRSRVRVSNEEVRLQFERERSKATVRTVPVHRDWFARYTTTVTDAQVDEWAAKNKAELDSAWEAQKASFTADCPLVSEIVVDVPADASDEDKDAAQKKLEDADRRLKSGAPFAAVAQQLSEGAQALSGGYIGCLSEAYGGGAAELLQAVGKLQPNERSGILTTSRGLHILQFHGKLKKEDIEKVGRRAVATQLAIRSSADEQAKQFATQLIERVKGGAKLEDAARELTAAALERASNRKAVEALALADDARPQVEISSPFPVTGNPIPDALPSEAAAAKAFELDKPDALHPQPIATERGFAVMQLKEKELTKPEQFEKEKPELVAAMQSAKAADALVRYLAQLRKAAGDEVKIDAALAEDPKVKEQPGDS